MCDSFFAPSAIGRLRGTTQTCILRRGNTSKLHPLFEYGPLHFQRSTLICSIVQRSVHVDIE